MEDGVEADVRMLRSGRCVRQVWVTVFVYTKRVHLGYL